MDGGDMDGGFGPGRDDSGRCGAAHSADDGGFPADGSESGAESGAVGSNPAVIERTPSP
jgi:hypothetical protein